MEQMQRYNQRLIEEMKNRQAQERGRLPKIQRGDAKTRMAMFKKSLRITSAPGTPEQEREKIKQVFYSVCTHTVIYFFSTESCEVCVFCYSLLPRRRRGRRTRDSINIRNMRTR